MLVCDYIVESIDGDYAHLRRTDLPEEELKLVARALLPFEITEGCRLHYEMMQYSIIFSSDTHTYASVFLTAAPRVLLLPWDNFPNSSVSISEYL